MTERTFTAKPATGPRHGPHYSLRVNGIEFARLRHEAGGWNVWAEDRDFERLLRAYISRRRDLDLRGVLPAIRAGYDDWNLDVDTLAKWNPQPLDVYLVSCTKTKAAERCAARDLYAPSDWFRKARAHVEARGAAWFVLSAEHGLVDPDQVVAPYETTLLKMRPEARLAWASKVHGELLRRGLVAEHVRISILAGEVYREHLELWLDATVPMRGLGLGEQKAWLLANTPAALELQAAA